MAKRSLGVSYFLIQDLLKEFFSMTIKLLKSKHWPLTIGTEQHSVTTMQHSKPEDQKAAPFPNSAKRCPFYINNQIYFVCFKIKITRKKISIAIFQPYFS